MGWVVRDRLLRWALALSSGIAACVPPPPPEPNSCIGQASMCVRLNQEHPSDEGCWECHATGFCRLVPNSGAPAACPMPMDAAVDAGEDDTCFTDSDCEAPRPACDFDTETCVECTNPVHCPEHDWCIEQRCVECISSLDCSAPTGVCDFGTYTCVGCRFDADCSDEQPRCDRDREECVQCVSAEDCPVEAPTCDSDTGSCISG